MDRIPSSSELVHSLSKYLLSTHCMPGTIIGMTVKFKSLFYDTHELWGKQLLTNSSLQPDFFFKLASNFPAGPLVNCPVQMPSKHPTGVQFCSRTLVTPFRHRQRHRDFSVLQGLQAAGGSGPQRSSGECCLPEGFFPQQGR